jgi:ABC-2 type transport system ATP-binding protein
MDEPAANLDPEARKIFFDLLAERQDDATMIISSHRLDEVSSLVNRVIEMDMGKVVLDDKVADDVSLTGAGLPHRAQAFRAGFRQGHRRLEIHRSDDDLVWEGRSPVLTACASSASFRATRHWSAISR